jgi:DNA repair protein RecO (recombination protein O)
MEKWQDQGIVLAVRAHGESGAIVSLLTEGHGRAAGYVRGARGSKMRGTLELGSVLDVEWQSRSGDGLGAFALELQRSYAADYMRDPLRLAALQSACGLCDEGVPEREGGEGMFLGLIALLDNLESEVWGAAYIMWEGVGVLAGFEPMCGRWGCDDIGLCVAEDWTGSKLRGWGSV